MPPPPPPPAPAAPPTPPVSNNALLQSIQNGAKLKKTVTNDRSAPIVEGPKPTAASRSPPSVRANSSANDSNRPSTEAPQLGGLFAGGMPKLRPSGSNRFNIAASAASPPEPARRAFAPQQENAVVNAFKPPQPAPRSNAPPPVPPTRTSPSTMSPPPLNRVARPTQPFAPPAVAPRKLSNPPPPPNPRGPAPPPPSRPSASDRNISPKASVVGNAPNPVSNFGGNTETEGRWTFHKDIPTPRSFPSGDLNPSDGIPTRPNRPPPPPPPTRSSVGKRGPPPPPPR